MDTINKNRIIIAVICLLIVACAALVRIYDIWPFEQDDKAAEPLVIKVEDFSVFLIESSEEIYRSNVKDPAMWAGLREKALNDREYELHYNWLYSTYDSWDTQRRNQLKIIMTTYESQYLAQSLIRAGKQNAGLDEIVKFMRDDGAYKEQRNILVDFYSWYGANYAVPHYEQIRPLLQRKVDVTLAMVEDNFDIINYLEKETGINRNKKQHSVELQLNMRLIGMSVYSRKKDTITTIQWNRAPEKIWTAVFNEFSGNFINTFTDSWSFKNMARKLKKDEKLSTKYKEDVPYTWDGWIEENLAEGFAKYLIFRKGISKDLREGTYVFDREYTQALANSFDPEKSTLKAFTSEFLKKNYDL